MLLPSFYSFFFKPIAVFGIYGGPLALGAGMTWYFIVWAFTRLVNRKFSRSKDHLETVAKDK